MSPLCIPLWRVPHIWCRVTAQRNSIINLCPVSPSLCPLPGQSSEYEAQHARGLPGLMSFNLPNPPIYVPSTLTSISPLSYTLPRPQITLTLFALYKYMSYSKHGAGCVGSAPSCPWVEWIVHRHHPCRWPSVGARPKWKLATYCNTFFSSLSLG